MKYIISGASSGLGFCLAERLILRGQVAGISRTIGRANSLLNSGNFTYIKSDLSKVSNKESFDRLIKNLILFIGDEPFTIILNAASFYIGENRLSHSRLISMFELNVFSLMSIVRELKELALRRVFIINSVAGIVGQCNQHEYSASKHAVVGFSRALAKSAKNENFDVMSINPGGMKTELWNDIDGIDTSDFLSPDVVADVCLSLILIPQRSFIDTMSFLPPSDV